MTREEASFYLSNMDRKYMEEGMSEALDIAIKELEQDTVPFDFELYQAGLMDMPKEMIEVLDKIRAEIEEYKSRQLTLAIGVDDLEKGKQIAIEYVLAIIDKYKANPTWAEGSDKE